MISRDDLPETPDWSPDPHSLVLSGEDFDALLARLDEPPTALPRLRALLRDETADETAYLTASPANAERLRASVARLHACPFDPCFVCQPHEGAGTYPPPNAVLGEN